jgi:hypothetical protein
MARAFFDSPLVGFFNSGMARLINAPVVGPLMRRNTVVVRYTGKRSGKTFQTPLSYQRRDDGVVIRVMAPDSKTWWRNFTGDGGQLTLVNFEGADRTGHAVARRDERGRVTVSVTLG